MTNAPTRQQLAALAANRDLPPAMRAQVWALLNFHDKIAGAAAAPPAQAEPVDLTPPSDPIPPVA